jgi:hypothetical protein
LEPLPLKFEEGWVRLFTRLLTGRAWKWFKGFSIDQNGALEALFIISLVSYLVDIVVVCDNRKLMWMSNG